MKTPSHAAPLLSRTLFTALLAGGLLVAGTVCAEERLVDPISNPQALEFSNVEMEIPDYDEPFQRYGSLVTDAAQFKQIVPGLSKDQVVSLLGEPRSRTSGDNGAELNYNFTLVMPSSKNYLVCQYKVVLDDQQQVKETVWRRNQCLAVVNQAATG